MIDKLIKINNCYFMTFGVHISFSITDSQGLGDFIPILYEVGFDCQKLYD